MTPLLDRTEGVDEAEALAAQLGCSFVMLPRGQFALVDNADVGIVAPYPWRLAANGYAIVRRGVYMHRLILGLSARQIADHANLNKLDNRRQNLRLCNFSQNICNRPRRRDNKASVFKGVSRCREKFVAKSTFMGRQYYLGIFASEVDAARAYDEWALQMFGEFARTNGV